MTNRRSRRCAPRSTRSTPRIYDTLNNGVYKAGFAVSQGVYEAAVAGVFDTLDWLDARLARRRYLLGDTLTEADIRLFTTLVRFDSVYFGHFKCNRRPLVSYPALWDYARALPAPRYPAAGQFRPHQRPLLRQSSLAQSERHRPGRAGPRLGSNRLAAIVNRLR